MSIKRVTFPNTQLFNERKKLGEGTQNLIQVLPTNLSVLEDVVNVLHINMAKKQYHIQIHANLI